MLKQDRNITERKVQEQFEILIVDDNPNNLSTLESILSQAGYKVRPAVNGKLAVQSAQSKSPDLILLDIKMPGMDGYDVCEKLKRNRTTCDIPILFISALDQPIDKVKAFEAGGMDFITKPFHLDEVLARVKTHLSLRTMQVNLVNKNSQLISEINERKHAEALLQKAHQELETKVRERTADLAETNKALHLEIEERKRSEEAHRKLEEQIRKTEKVEAIGTLARGIAHDFNNIIGVVIGCTDLALNAIPYNSSANRDLQKVQDAGYRAKNLVKQILTFSRESKDEKKPLVLQHLVKDTLSFIESLLPKNISIYEDLNHPTGNIMADPTQMQQVVMNLCTNAAHAMKETGGRIIVRLDSVNLNVDDAACHQALSPGPHLQLIVSDDGYGMDKVTIERIFDPFFTTKKAGEGTGLGLSVSLGIIQDSHGAILVESKPNKGSQFRVLLPKFFQDRHSDTRKKPDDSLNKNNRFLIVESDIKTESTLGQMLKSLGYQSIVRTNEPAALEKFRSSPETFDLIFIDQATSEKNSPDISSEFLKIRVDIPIILCTGFSKGLEEEQNDFPGIQAILFKPLLRDRLATVIQKFAVKTQGGNFYG